MIPSYFVFRKLLVLFFWFWCWGYKHVPPCPTLRLTKKDKFLSKVDFDLNILVRFSPPWNSHLSLLLSHFNIDVENDKLNVTNIISPPGYSLIKAKNIPWGRIYCTYLSLWIRNRYESAQICSLSGTWFGMVLKE